LLFQSTGSIYKYLRITKDRSKSLYPTFDALFRIASHPPLNNSRLVSRGAWILRRINAETVVFDQASRVRVQVRNARRQILGYREAGRKAGF